VRIVTVNASPFTEICNASSTATTSTTGVETPFWMRVEWVVVVDIFVGGK